MYAVLICAWLLERGITILGTPMNSLNGNSLSGTEESPCTLGSLFTCNKNEICHQTEGSQTNTGLCVCLSGYLRDLSGTCQAISQVPTTTGRAKPADSVDDPSSYSSSITTLQIALPIVLIALLAILVGIAFKFRWFTKLRMRFMQRTRVYEEMLIDGDDVAIQTIDSNPVA